MEKIKNWFGMLALVLAMAVVGNLEAQTDSRIDGVWVMVDDDGVELEMTLSDGDFETSGDFAFRGNYTVNDGILSRNATHVFVPSGEPWDLFGIESKWYAMNEFIRELSRIPLMAYAIIQGMSDELITQFISGIVSLPPASYSVDDDSLILTIDNGDNISVQIYNKK